MTNEEFSNQIEAIAKKKGTISKFEKNLIATAVYSAPLAKRLLELQGNKKINVFTGKDPLDINLITKDGSRYMYENPLKDIEEQLDSFEKEYSRYGALFLYGLGNGVLLKGILGNQTHKTIVVFEPEIEIIYIVFHFFDFSTQIFKNRLVIFQSDILDMPHYYIMAKMKDVLLSARLFNLYITSNFYDIYKDDMQKVTTGISKAIMQLLREVGNDGVDSLIGVRQTTEHIPDMLESIPLSHIKKQRNKKNKTAIIVSTGPSLNKQLKLLKKAQSHATIISIDASYPILKKHGIKPDYVACIEREPLTAEFFASKPSEFDENIIFVVATLVHPNTVKYLKGRNTAYVFRPLAYEKGFGDFDFGYIGGGQSAAHLAFDLSVQLGHEKIVLIGQDLAYGKGRSTHAKGHVTTTENEEAMPSEYAPAYGGDGKVETMIVGTQFRQFFEVLITLTKKDHKEISVYNCTEGGARIEGAIEIPFKELLEKEVFNETKVQLPLPNKLNDRQKEAKYKKFSKRIKATLKYGESLQKKCEKLFLKLAKQVERGKKLKEKGKAEKINYDKLQKLSFEIGDFKASLDDKRFLSSYYAVLNSFIQHQELEFAAIIAKPSETLEEKREKLFHWVSVQGNWLFNIAGGISVMRENIENCSQKWLR